MSRCGFQATCQARPRMNAYIRTKERELEEQPAKGARTAAYLRYGRPEGLEGPVSPAARGPQAELVERRRCAERLHGRRTRSRRQIRGCAGVLRAGVRVLAAGLAGLQDCRMNSGPLRNNVHQNQGRSPLRSDWRARLVEVIRDTGILRLWLYDCMHLSCCGSGGCRFYSHTGKKRQTFFAHSVIRRALRPAGTETRPNYVFRPFITIVRERERSSAKRDEN